jgi:3-oxoadipate enol-lactonase
MTFANVAGFKLHYSLEGDSSRPVVVLSNSLGADLSMWDAQVDALLPAFRILRYDTRGHGKSEVPAGPCTLSDLGGDLVGLLDALHIDRAQVCGVSLGGMTAMWVGVHAPHRVAGLVLSNTAAKIGTRDSWNERIAKVESEGLTSIADAVMSRWFTPGFPERNLTVQKGKFLGCSLAGYVAASGAIRDADLRGEIRSISAPTLVLSGENDVVTPPNEGRALQAAIPGSIFREVPGAHLSNIEEAAAYNQALLPFLQQQATSEAIR